MGISLSVNVSPMGETSPIATEETYRRKLLNHFYGPTWTPVIPAPTLVETNWTPAYPYINYTIQSPALLRIDRLTFVLDGDIYVYAYHLVNRNPVSKGLAISHEGHSYFDLPNHPYHIQRLLNLGWHVCLVQMPQKFVSPSPPNPPNPVGMLGHDAWAEPKEAFDSGYLRTFFLPTLTAKKHLVDTYDFDKLIIVGLSGGGWTAAWIAALFPEFKYTASIAGSGQWELFSPTVAYDYEQYAGTFNGHPPRPAFSFLPENYVDLYAMGGGNGRLFRLGYVENDGIIPSAGKHPQIDAFVASANTRAAETSGSVQVYYDTSQSVHEISNATADTIVSDLLSTDQVVTGPSGASVVEPTFANMIAWYRGDSMTSSQLFDRGGGGRHAAQATGVNQGIVVPSDPYIKQPCMQFSAGGSGDDFYQWSGSALPAYTEYTIAAVVKVPSPGSASNMILATSGASGTTRPWPFLYSNQSSQGIWVFGLTSNDAQANYYNNVEWTWVVGTHTAGARKLYINGILAAVNNGADSSTALSRIGVGRSMDASPIYPLTGSIAELILTGHALTDGGVSVGQRAVGEMAGLASYIGARYGL